MLNLWLIFLKSKNLEELTGEEEEEDIKLAISSQQRESIIKINR
jgi:hypothetical protein